MALPEAPAKEQGLPADGGREPLLLLGGTSVTDPAGQPFVDHALDLEVAELTAEHAEREHRVDRPLQPDRVHALGEGGQRDHIRHDRRQVQVLLKDAFDPRPVDGGYELPLVEGGDERPQHIGVLLGPGLADRQPHHGEIGRCALVEVDKFLDAVAFPQEGHERLGHEGRVNVVALERRADVGELNVLELHVVQRDPVGRQERVDKDGADVLRFQDRDPLALEARNRCRLRMMRDDEREHVGPQEACLGNDPEVGELVPPVRVAGRLVHDVGHVVRRHDVGLAVHQVVDLRLARIHQAELHVQPLAGEEPLLLCNEEPGGVDRLERIYGDRCLFQLPRSAMGSASAAGKQQPRC